MLIFYVDESGSHSMAADANDPMKLAAGSSEWFVLSAVGIRDTSRRPLAEALWSLKQTHFGPGDPGDWVSTEIKGRRLANTRAKVEGARLRSAPDVYPGLSDETQLVAVEHEIERLFNLFRPLTFTIAIDKARLLRERQDPSALGWAYAYLYRRIALTLERVHPGEGGVLVADRQDEHERYFASGELTRFRDEIAHSSRYKAEYRLLLDRPLWIDPALSTWDREIIQLADLVAFTTHDGLDRGFESRPLWSTIRRSLAVHRDTGHPEGEGLVIYPFPNEGWPTTKRPRSAP